MGIAQIINLGRALKPQNFAICHFFHVNFALMPCRPNLGNARKGNNKTQNIRNEATP